MTLKTNLANTTLGLLEEQGLRAFVAAALDAIPEAREAARQTTGDWNKYYALGCVTGMEEALRHVARYLDMDTETETP